MTSSSGVGDQALDVLLVDYQIARDDDRGVQATTATVGTIGVALLAGLLALLVGDCRFRTDPTQQCYNVPDAALALTPVLPLAVLSYALILNIVSTTRSFYMRSLEAEIRGRVGGTLTAAPSVVVPSGIELTMAIIGPSRGRRAYLALLSLVIAGCIAVFVGLTTIILLNVSTIYRFTIGPFYIVATALFIKETIMANTGGRTLMQRAVRIATSPPYPGLSLTPRVGRARPPGERSLLSYLLFPRTQELIKFVFIPIAFGIGYTLQLNLGQSSTIDPVRALIMWIAFEYFCYQARYQWNDIRGLASDQAHPGRTKRGRLPIWRWGGALSILTSAAVALARVALFVLACNYFGGSETGLLLTAGASAWILAFAYEYLRSSHSHNPRFLAAMIWALSGGGYAIRLFVGLILAGLMPNSPTVVLLVVATWMLGVQFVTMGWLLEAIGHCYGPTWERVWYPAGGHGPNLGDKPHLLWLIPFSGVTATAAPLNETVGRYLDHKRALMYPSVKIYAPWNLATLLSALCATAAMATVGPWTNWIGVIVAVLMAVGLASVRETRWRLMVGVAAVALLEVIYIPTQQYVPAVVAGSSVAIIALAFSVFGKSNYAELRDAVGNIQGYLRNRIIAVQNLGCQTVRLLIGERTWHFLFPPPRT